MHLPKPSTSAVALTLTGALLLPGLQAGVGVAAEERSTDTATEPAERLWPQKSSDVSVERVSGRDRISTSVAVSRRIYPEGGAGGAVLARADVLADALAGVPLASAIKGPLLLTGARSLHEEVLDELRRGVAPGGRVVLLGGTNALSRNVEAQVRRAGFRVERVTGSDRIATSVAVAEALAGLAGRPRQVMVTSGWSQADAPTASAVAATNTWPVILSGPNGIAPTVSDFLTRNAVDHVTLVGGRSVLGDAVEAGVAATGRTSARLSGKDRYQTSQRVLNYFTRQAPALVVASGEAISDTLAAATLAAASNMPLVLTPPSGTTSSTLEVLTDYAPSHIVVVGGSGAVNQSTVDTLASAAAEGGRRHKPVPRERAPVPSPVPAPAPVPVPVPAPTTPPVLSPTPVPVPPLPRTILTLPASIGADCSRDVAAEINAFIAASPDGALIRFAPEGCYLVQTAIRLVGRNGITLDGRGATLERTELSPQPLRYPDRDHNGHVILDNVSGVTVRGFTMNGTNDKSSFYPEDGYAVDRDGKTWRVDCAPDSGWLANVTCWTPTFEFEHGVEVRSSDTVLVEDLVINEVWGDGVYIGGDTSSSDIVLRDLEVNRNGRQGIAVSQGERILIERTRVTSSRRAGLDLEPNLTRSTVRDLEVRDSLLMSWHPAVASEGRGDVSDIWIHDNEIAGPAVPWISVSSSDGTLRSGWRIERNRTLNKLGSPAAAMRFTNVGDLLILDNEVKVADSQGRRAVAIVGGFGALTITGNDFAPGGCGIDVGSVPGSVVTVANNATICP